jgi:DNA-binding PucR family transcriptional regulator
MKEQDLQESLTLTRWLQQMKENDNSSDIPASIQQLDWNERVPMLIEWEGQTDQSVQNELKGLLKGYFPEEGTWIAEMKEGEWLILIPESHFTLVENESRDLSVQIAEGLAEAIYSEIGIKVRIIVDRSISSSEEVGNMWERLLQGIQLAKTYHKQKQVHVTWQFGLEQLLENLEEEAVEQFLAHLRAPEMFQEKEMRKTVETFLKLNLNVSETARQLFIHRNTLLYRLDRLKQETGLDLRQFEDAVLAKIALLLTTVGEEV